jgi:hypothetical protein
MSQGTKTIKVLTTCGLDPLKREEKLHQLDGQIDCHNALIFVKDRLCVITFRLSTHVYESDHAMD